MHTAYAYIMTFSSCFGSPDPKMCCYKGPNKETPGVVQKGVKGMVTHTRN